MNQKDTNAFKRLSQSSSKFAESILEVLPTLKNNLTKMKAEMSQEEYDSLGDTVNSVEHDLEEKTMDLRRTMGEFKKTMSKI